MRQVLLLMSTATHTQVWWRPHKQRRSKKKYGTLRHLLDFSSIHYQVICFNNLFTVFPWHLLHNIMPLQNDCYRRLWTLDKKLILVFCELFIVFRRVVLLNKHRYMHLALHQEPFEPKQRNNNDQWGKREEEFFREFFWEISHSKKQFSVTPRTIIQGKRFFWIQQLLRNTCHYKCLPQNSLEISLFTV